MASETARPSAGVGAGSKGVAAAQFAALYVGDLAPETTESHIYEVFSRISPAVTVRLCKDKFSQRSLGYAYVNFQTLEDAERALKELNFSLINNRECRVCFIQRDASARRNAIGNLVVKRLTPKVTSKHLDETFRNFGNVLSCKVAKLPDGTSKGYGFVQMETEEQAEAALRAVNGLEVEGVKIIVERYIPKTQRPSTSRYSNLYIKNIPSEWTEGTLREQFASFGEVTSVFLATDENGKSRGFGFVNFREPAAAEAAATQMNGKEVEGSRASVPGFVKTPSLPEMSSSESGDSSTAAASSTATSATAGGAKLKLYVSRAKSRVERDNELKKMMQDKLNERNSVWRQSNLIVKNLTESFTSEDLRDLFTPYGKIESAVVPNDDMGFSRCVGFVLFSNPEDATKALQALHHKMVNGKPLNVSKWLPRQERHQQNVDHHLQLRRAAAASNNSASSGASSAAGGASSATGAAAGSPGIMQYPYILQFVTHFQQELTRASEQYTALATQIAQCQANRTIVPPELANNFLAQQRYVQQVWLMLSFAQWMLQATKPDAAQAAAAAAAAAQMSAGRRGAGAAGAGAGATRAGVPMPVAGMPPAAMFPGMAGVGIPHMAGAAASRAAKPESHEPQAKLRQEILDLRDDSARKEFIGNHLMPKVQAMVGDRANKIVGMILQNFHVTDLVSFLDDDSTLQSHVEDAAKYLEQHSGRSASAVATSSTANSSSTTAGSSGAGAVSTNA